MAYLPIIPATTSGLGSVICGSGLAVTPSGTLSAISSGTDLVSVKLTSTNYTALLTDYYIGTTNHNIKITLPNGVVGKVYYVKNQDTGNITVTGTSSQTIDGSLSITLGAGSSVIVVFDGARWNIVS